MGGRNRLSTQTYRSASNGDLAPTVIPFKTVHTFHLRQRHRLHKFSPSSPETHTADLCPYTRLFWPISSGTHVRYISMLLLPIWSGCLSITITQYTLCLRGKWDDVLGVNPPFSVRHMTYTVYRRTFPILIFTQSLHNVVSTAFFFTKRRAGVTPALLYSFFHFLSTLQRLWNCSPCEYENAGHGQRKRTICCEPRLS